MASLFKRQQHQAQLDEDTDEDPQVDPELRLRTVQTAHSTIAESIRSENRRAERRRKSRRWQTKGLFGKGSGLRKQQTQPEHDPEDDLPRPTEPLQDQTDAAAEEEEVAKRRTVYVNIPLPAEDVKPNGDPVKSYVRNKVRTTKYSPLTFLPKNLYEQFRRVANLFFLVLVLIQVWPLFGAAAPQVAMLPLVVILLATAIKDGIEDYRRSTLDEQVNNSAATKLGGWRNVNQQLDPRSALEKFLGIGSAPDKVTKGVKRLREREAAEGKNIVLIKSDAPDAAVVQSPLSAGPDSASTVEGHQRSLDDIQSEASGSLSLDRSHSYPPIPHDNSTANLQGSVSSTLQAVPPNSMGYSTTSFKSSMRTTGGQIGVVDWSRQTPGTASWERTLWKKLDVGDIVLLRDNDQIPADIIVLSTSDADGLCYVETKNLDGETNLKPRKSLKATSSITSEEDIEHSSFRLDSEAPHANLYNYNGVLRYRTRSTDGILGPGEEKVEPVTINDMLLRGCAVRNTSWIIGLVVFTGADTKIMLNGGETPSKRSKIEKETNFNVVMNFIILIAMVIVTALVNGYYDAKSNTSAAYYEINAEVSSSPVVNAIVTGISCLIAFQNIVPISLYISIEIVKTIQAYFINQDIDMYYEPYDTCCVPKTWNISDDLGQIEYIFSDKTGTLTQNIMEFQKCSINGIVYGEGVTEAMRGAAKREGRDEFASPEDEARKIESMKEGMLQRMSKAFKNRYLRPEQLTLVSPQLADHLADRSSPQRGHLIAFFRALAICHTVLAEKPEPRDQPFVLDYKAESPDEAALVGAARDVGFPFVSRTSQAIDIEVMGQNERYVPLRVLEFNSTRKRMSTIVRNPDGKLVLYCKGADSVIYERLAANHDPQLKAVTAKDMEAFANGGLRTLAIAYRYLTEEEYFNWSRTYDAAASSTKDRDDEIEKAAASIERDLVILGATALEDKLQRGVPEAIETLHRAGIKLWILTGDKLQTAIEIGFSCNLLKSDMEIMILSADNADTARIQIEGGINKIASILGPPTRDSSGATAPSLKGFAVVIDGDTLRYALDDSLKELFLNLGTQCDTVVCCRVSPAQKALTVKLVKEGRNAMTLSIGDGANDVAMIQEANIGCGLIGLEGSQAAMSADYAFGQFRFLTKLLLVHGRWSYQRIADMHSNFFYKNVVWTFAMFWYLFYNSWDATYLYQYTFILLYNLAFTALPVIVMGAFDQDLNAKASLAYPQLYKRGILGLEYTRAKFWAYMVDGFYQSAMVYFIPQLVWGEGNAMSWNGKMIESHADFGTTVSVAAIFAVNIFVGLNTSYWTWITWLVTIGSTAFLLLWILFYSLFTTIDFTDEIFVLFSTVDFLASFMLGVVIAIAPRYLYKYFMRTYAPLDKDIIREMWVLGDLKDRLGLERRGKAGSQSERVSLFRRHRLDNLSEVELPTRNVYDRPAEDSPSDAGPPDAWNGREKSEQTPQPQAIHSKPDGSRRTPSPSAGHDKRYSYYSSSEIPSAVVTPTTSAFLSGPSAPRPAHLDVNTHDLRPPPRHTAEASSDSRLSDRSYRTAQEGSSDDDEALDHDEP